MKAVDEKNALRMLINHVTCILERYITFKITNEKTLDFNCFYVMFYVVTAALEMPMAICHIVTQTIKITLQCAPGHVIVGNWIRTNVDAGHWTLQESVSCTTQPESL